MNPPPIGEALGVGWEKFKANMVPVIIGLLIAGVVNIIPFMGIPGMMLVSLKALRGQTPEPKDALVGFQAFVDNLLIGLLQAVGMVACCIGVYVTQGLFFQGTFLVVDKGMNWSAAKDECLAQLKDSWLPWTIFVFVVGLVGSLGAILCGIGVLLTAPIATIAFAYAYEQTLGKRA